jgi:hypothetical protein
VGGYLWKRLETGTCSLARRSISRICIAATLDDAADQVFLDCPFTNLITASTVRSAMTFSMTIKGKG